MSRRLKPIHLLIGAALFMLLTCSAPLAPALPVGIQGLASDSPGNQVQAAIDVPTSEIAALQGVASAPTTSVVIIPTSVPTRLSIAVTSSPTNQQLATSFDRYLTELSTGGFFSGAILVASGDQILFAKGYGPFDSSGQVVNTAQSRFRLASLTKQFTAMAIMILQDQGRLTISDSICMYLDNCPAIWQPITIRALLNHTSGIVDYTDYLDYEATEGQPATPQQLVARFRDQPLAFTPGELYDYCNSGYVLLGLIIERVSGKPYTSFIRSAIFEPLGMQNSGFDASETFDTTIAFPYRASGQTASFLNATTLFAAGGLYSTVEDLYRWDQAIASNQLIPPALRDEMLTPGNGSYGYGWKIERPAGRLRLSHAGNMTGVSNFNARYPEHGLTVIVLSNLENTNAIGISDYITNLVLGSS